MQLAKIRRKTQPVKKFFYEIWKIAVDLGGFGARRQGRRGVRSGRGRRTARSAVGREGRALGGAAGRGAARALGGGAAEGARRREELPGASAARGGTRGGKAGVRGDGASTAGHKRGAGTASGTAGRARRAARARRGGRCRVQARLGARGRRDSERNAARGARAGRKTTHLRRTPATNRPELALSAIRTASRMKAMRFGRLYALPPPNSTNRKPNRHRRRPILCILIRFAESQNADRTLMRVGSKGDRIAARTTIREGGGDDTREQERCTRAGVMRGPNTTNRQLKDGTQLQSLWSDRRTRPESPKPRGEGLSPIGTIRFGGV